MGHSFTYNGTDFSTYGVTVTGRTVPGSASWDTPIRPVAGRHGGVAGVGYLSPLDISLPCLVEAASSTALQDNLDNIRASLAVTEDKLLSLDSISGRGWYSRAIGGYDVNMLGPTSCMIRLDFVAADPVGYASTVTSQTIDLSTDTTTTAYIPASTSSVVKGTAVTYPTIEVTRAEVLTEGFTWAYRVENADTGNIIRGCAGGGCAVTGDLRRFWRVNIDDEYLEYRNSTAGSWLDGMECVISNEAWPSLPPATRTEVSAYIYGSTAYSSGYYTPPLTYPGGTLDVTYYARYI